TMMSKHFTLRDEIGNYGNARCCTQPVCNLIFRWWLVVMFQRVIISPSRGDSSLSTGLGPSHRRPALAVCWCLMAWWDAKGCCGRL
ncbi:hypothetical protein GOODEAATRI_026355, partial [Goodea atripinnis]